jgi:hypothetical protein
MRTAAMIRVGGIGVIAGLVLTGCANLPVQKAAAPPERPMITQAQAAALMKNYDAINNKANAKRDSKLMATVEDGDLLTQSLGSYSMDSRLGDKTPYKPFTHPKPIAFVPPAGAYPRAFFVYSKVSRDAKFNVLDVFRRSDAAAPWKSVMSGSIEGPLPPIAVGPSGLATVVAPGASGYAVKPIDVAPLLAKAMLSAKSPEAARFATSPILTKYHTKAAKEQSSAVMGNGTATRKFVPTKDIYAIKTKDGGVLVTGGMDWQVASSLTGGWRWTPEKSWNAYVLHPTPYQSYTDDYNAMWAVQIPVKGPLKLVLWSSSWANFSAS